MKLYFRNSMGGTRIIAEPETREDVQKEISKFCKDRNFTIHYIRTWMNNDGAEVYDVGSWSEFFYLFDN